MWAFLYLNYFKVLGSARIAWVLTLNIHDDFLSNFSFTLP
ncbi:hypothetical protein VIBNISOn1_800033 [Vibrio nigripulchritudo SOn1]|uniref:Uncharacterized protein n=1 Tax=Vibrio nigripulchritudo SOn1 TaxID=1238450 RepID=A0AAV2VX31_9VIBR|nr:hypothetical protein VIBNISOn1_800033 [Vibrio nigripulchritudo SOn1]